MKKVLIRLVSNSELLSYEAISLAMTMATFDNHVQLFCDQSVYTTLINPDNRVYGMLQSLELYDMPKMWLLANANSDWLMNNVDIDLASQLSVIVKNIDLTEFDAVLSF